MQYLTNFDLPVCRQGLWGILKRWLLSLQALPLWAVFALVAMANVANVRFAVALNEWNGRFFNALQKVDASAIYDALFDFIWLASALILLLVMTQYIKNRLLLSLRRELTFRLIDVWMSPMAAHYQLRESGREPDNPDQRIIEDSRELVGLAVNLSLSFLESVLTIGSFSVILWNLSGSVLVFGIEVPGYMFWVCLAYTVFATVITHWIGHPLKRLNYASQAKEADLRYAFIEKRRHADAIAGAQGEAFEAQHLKERLEALLAVLIAYVKKQRDLDLFTVGLGQVTHLAPIFFSLPALLSGHVQLGGLMQIRGAFTDVARSFSWFIFAYDNLASLAAAWERLSHLVSGLEEAENQRRENVLRTKLKRDEKKRFVRHDALVTNLDLELPTTPTPKHIELTVAVGDTVFLTGSSGVGKSTFLKTVAGFKANYTGRLNRNIDQKLLWLPQKSYLMKGTLRDNLTYPCRKEDSQRTIDDRLLSELLVSFDLGHLVGRLDDTSDWSNVLSGGEQQRIVLIRALLTRPDLLLMDETTSALDPHAAIKAFEFLRKRLPETGIVFVTHQDCFIKEQSRQFRIV